MERMVRMLAQGHVQLNVQLLTCGVRFLGRPSESEVRGR
jgi:hypothetical protein